MAPNNGPGMPPSPPAAWPAKSVVVQPLPGLFLQAVHAVKSTPFLPRS
ncbi:hypothetical protein SEA_KYLIEMAC_2 [Arthrobacter phage KylieMac]|nr:hypothetical protein SEA_KYLIEMAC_2 [Arthrobacter phage KylieMac]